MVRGKLLLGRDGGIDAGQGTFDIPCGRHGDGAALSPQVLPMRGHEW